MLQCFWADKDGDESDDEGRDVDDEVETEEDDDDDDEGEGGILLPMLMSPSSSSSRGPRCARRTGSRMRPWKRPNTTVRTNTLNKKECVENFVFD